MLPGRTTLTDGLVHQFSVTAQRGSDLDQDEDTGAPVSMESDRQCSDSPTHTNIREHHRVWEKPR